KLLPPRLIAVKKYSYAHGPRRITPKPDRLHAATAFARRIIARGHLPAHPWCQPLDCRDRGTPGVLAKLDLEPLLRGRSAVGISRTRRMARGKRRRLGAVARAVPCGPGARGAAANRWARRSADW